MTWMICRKPFDVVIRLSKIKCNYLSELYAIQIINLKKKKKKLIQLNN